MKTCSFEGCDKPARSRGYCQTHYMRMHRHGTVEAGRPDWYGSKASHPLYVTHKAAKAVKALCEPWLDFWKFVEDVSPVPEGNFRLHRIDSSLPYSKENCEWRESVYTKQAYPDAAELKKIRSDTMNLRKRAEHDPVKHRVKSLKLNHGITVEQYDSMLAVQGGVCEICGKPETKARANGNLLPLSVDHCHKTRQSGTSKGIRGLLCQACNIGLGKFDDDPDLLRKAAAYLDKYRA